MIYRMGTTKDIEFMKQMLYEAVYWRLSDNPPTYEESLSMPVMVKAFEAWGKVGDIAIVAEDNGNLAGAAWIRYWTESNCIRGYVQDDIPVLVIGVHKDHRQKGIGFQLMEALNKEAINAGISRISLCVSKDNHAMHLYEKQKYEVAKDIGDSLLMIKDLTLTQ